MRRIRNRRLLTVLVSAGCLTAGLGTGAAYLDLVVEPGP